MVDTRSPAQRRHIMQSVKSRNTKPEIVVRKALHGLGFRFRIHRADLPGKPDIVLPRWRVAVNVHGCFWHGHRCRYGRLPKSNIDFWKKKIRLNKERDRRVIMELRKLGWSSITIWQCQTKHADRLIQRLVTMLSRFVD